MKFQLQKLWSRRRDDGGQSGTRQHVQDGRRAGEGDNPYLSARRTWNSLLAANKASRDMWQVMGVSAMLVALASVGGIAYIGSQSKFVPYVIEVNKLGEHAAVKPAERAAKADVRVLRSAIAEWIAGVRLVTPDVALQRKAVFKVYSMLAANDPATNKMNEFLNGSEDANPFKRAAKETVSIEIETPLPQTPETWQVDWVETTRDRQGVLKGQPQRWRALVTIYTVEPSPDLTEAQLRDNPFGVHVRDFTWTRQP